MHQLEDLQAENTRLASVATDAEVQLESARALAAPAKTTEPATPGRLALLLVDGTDSDLIYLEPYVIQSEGEALAIQHVDSGQADRAYLVRALYAARRQVEHGAITAPAVQVFETVQG